MKSDKHNYRSFDPDIRVIDIDEDYKEKIRRYKKRKRITVYIIVAVLLLIVGSIAVISYFHKYESYKVIREIEHSDSTYVRYEAIDDLLVRYTRDGITLYQNDEQVVWSTTFEMQKPTVDTNGEYIIIYEEGMNQVYLFDLENSLFTYETTMPIVKACVSKKGTIAMLVEEEEGIHRILYVDSEGETIAEGRSTFAQKGYPLDMGISGDGYKLCISYCIIDGASLKTNIVFYSFDDIGDSSIDNIVTDDIYADTIIPQVEFLEDESLVAFGDNCILVYDNHKKPAVKKEIDVVSEIASIFYDEKYFGTVTEEDNQHIITVYNKKGILESEIKTNFDYTNIAMSSGRILLHNSAGWQVYLKNGHFKAEGEFSQEIGQMVPAGYDTYMIVTTDKIEKIRLSD